MLDHQKLETTMIYTRVSMTMLREVHAATHPAEQAARTQTLHNQTCRTQAPSVTLEPVTDLHVQIPDDVAERLKQAAAERGTSAEPGADDALVSYAEARQPLSFAGNMLSGCGDLSERVRDILRSDPRQ